MISINDNVVFVFSTDKKVQQTKTEDTSLVAEAEKASSDVRFNI